MLPVTKLGGLVPPCQTQPLDPSGSWLSGYGFNLTYKHTRAPSVDVSIIPTSPNKLHWMVLSLSRSPDALQGLPMASHGHDRRVQHGIRAHSAPKPQGMPLWLPTTSLTSASSYSRSGPTRPNTHTHRAHNYGIPVASKRPHARPGQPNGEYVSHRERPRRWSRQNWPKVSQRPA